MMLDGNCLTTFVIYKATVSTNHDVGWKLSHHIGHLPSDCLHQPWCWMETVSPHWSSTKLRSPPTMMLDGNCLTTLVIYQATVSTNHDVGWKLSHHIGHVQSYCLHQPWCWMETVSPHWSSTKRLSPPTMMLDGNCLTTTWVIYKATVSINHDVGWKLSRHIGHVQSYCLHQPWCWMETVSPHWSSTKLLSPPTMMLAGNCLTTLVIYKATVSINHDVGWKLSHRIGYLQSYTLHQPWCWLETVSPHWSSTKLLSPPTMMLAGNCLTTLVIYKATVSINHDVGWKLSHRIGYLQSYTLHQPWCWMETVSPHRVIYKATVSTNHDVGWKLSHHIGHLQSYGLHQPWCWMETVSPHWSSTKWLSPPTMMLDGNCLTTTWVIYKATVSINHDVGWKLSHHIGHVHSHCLHQPWCWLETVSPHWSSTKLLSPPTMMLAGNCLTALVIYKATISTNHDVGWKLSHHIGYLQSYYLHQPWCWLETVSPHWSSTNLLSPPTMMLNGNCLTTLVIYKATVSTNHDVGWKLSHHIGHLPNDCLHQPWCWMETVSPPHG